MGQLTPPPPISAKFRDDEIGPFAVKVGQSELSASTSSCWAKQGSATAVVSTWRVDVLRFLPIGSIAAQPNYHKRLVNSADLTLQGEDPHRVELPDSGNGNQFPESAGASLVVIYRHSDSPLTGIVLYEGFNHTPSTATMSQTLRGFFQRATGAVGKLTQMVGNGQPNTSEQVSFNQILQTSVVDPFNSSPSSQRGWRSLHPHRLEYGRQRQYQHLRPGSHDGGHAHQHLGRVLSVGGFSVQCARYGTTIVMDC